MSAPPPYLGAAPTVPVPGALATPRTRRRNGWLIAILATCIVGATGVVAVGALFLVGVTVPGAEIEPTGELVAEELAWTTHDDAAGRFTVELPGAARLETVEMPGPMGPTDVEAVAVDGTEFGASVLVYEAAVQPGVTFEQMPMSESAMERAVEQGGFQDARIVERRVVEGSSGLELDLELSGSVRGDDGVMFTRLVASGGDLYEINVVGPVEHRSELAAVRDRIGESLVVTTY